MPLLTLTLLALALVACGTAGDGGTKSAATAPPTSVGAVESPTTSTTSASATLTGTWNGEWQNTAPDNSKGTFRIVWTQASTALTGTISITGTPCLTGGSVSGSVAGGRIDFGVVTGQSQVTYTGAFDGGRLSGTYTTTCGNARGTWSATRI